jgi:hypothetical protein
MAWTPDGSEAWICIENSDVLVRLVVDVDGIPTINAPVVNGGSSIRRVDLQSDRNQIACKAPQGVVIDRTGQHAFVLGFVSRSVSVVDLATGTVVDSESSSAQPPVGSEDEKINLGKELFHSSRGPDGRMSQESWGTCSICHPNGLSDSLTWMFDAGPRQTIPLDGMFDHANVADQRILNWSAVRDENQDFELNTRGVFNGRGLIDDDRLLFTWGGSSNGADLAEALEYQAATNVVGTSNDLAAQAVLPSLPDARRDFAVATLLDGRVMIVGGRQGIGDGTLVGGGSSVLLLTRGRTRWSRRAAPASPRATRSARRRCSRTKGSRSTPSAATPRPPRTRRPRRSSRSTTSRRTPGARWRRFPPRAPSSASR